MNNLQIEYIDKDELIAYINNAKLHPMEQVKQIASSIREFGFLAPIIIDKDNTIIAGHGRVQASELLGLDKIPAIRVEHLTEAQKKAYIIADNKLNLNTGFDYEKLELEFKSILELEDDFDLEITGFSDIEIEDILGLEEQEEEQETQYTTKIEIPIYEPRENVSLDELADTTKRDELIDRIKNLKIDKKIKDFLLESANRLVIFNYEKIADYYAIADKNVQELMEDMALVHIDFDRAIELGFVELTKELEAIREEFDNNE